MSDIFVGLLGSKNLSQSSLITRNLFSTLQVGEVTHKSTHLECEDVRFAIASAEPSLVVTVRNGQTQTIMFVRAIPLNLVLGSQQTVALWIAVYGPGDPRNQAFDDTTPPRPDMPQIHLSFRLSSQTRPTYSSPMQDAAFGRGSDVREARGSDMREARGSDARDARWSIDSRAETISIREKERQAEDIKTKLSALADAKRQAQSDESRLQDISREVDAVHRQVQQAEADLKVLQAARAEAERSAQEAREGVNRAQETLRQRELSILELRSTRDEAVRQLAQVLKERDDKRTNMDTSMRHFNEEVSSMAAELDRWRAEAGGLSEALQRCDRRVLELRERGEKARKSREAGHGGREEANALQRQLDAAVAELESARNSAIEQASRAQEVEGQHREVQAQLANGEAAARQAKLRVSEFEENDKMKLIELRAEADATEKELIAHMGLAAQLEGKVSESRNQLRDGEARIRLFTGQAEQHQTVHNELEKTVTCLNDELHKQELEGEEARGTGASLEDRIRQVKQELEACQQTTAQIENQRREASDGQARRSLELDATRRVVESVLKVAGGEAARFKQQLATLQEEEPGGEAALEQRLYSLEETNRRVGSTTKELEKLTFDRARRVSEQEEAEQRLAELGPELERTLGQLRSADEEAAAMRAESASEDSERRARERELEAELNRLHFELEEQRAAGQAQERECKALTASIDESRRLEPEKRQQAEHLRRVQLELKQDQDRLKATIEDAQQRVRTQQAAAARLEDSLAKGRKEIASAAGSMEERAKRQDDLQSSLEMSKTFWAGKAEAVRREIKDAEGRLGQTLSELSRLRATRVQLGAQRSELNSANQEVAERCAATRASYSAASSEDASRLRTIEEMQAKAAAEEAELNQICAELEGKLGESTAALTAKAQEHSQLDATLSSHKANIASQTATLELCREEVAAVIKESTLAEHRVAELRANAEAFQTRTVEIRAQQQVDEASAMEAERLLVEHTAAAASHQRRLQENSATLGKLDMSIEEMRNTSPEQMSPCRSGKLASKNAEIDLRNAQANELEREVMSLRTQIEIAGKNCSMLQETLQRAEAQDKQAREDLIQKSTRIGTLQQELQILEERRGKLQASVAATQLKVQAAQEAAIQVEAQARVREFELTNLTARSADASKERRSRVQAIQNEVTAQDRLGAEAASTAALLAVEVKAARENRDGAKARLGERQRAHLQCSADLKQVELELQQAAQYSYAANEDAHQQLRILSDRGHERVEEVAHMVPSDGDVAAEEQKVKLLKEQLASRKETLAKVRAEGLDLQVARAALGTELDQQRRQMSDLGDKLAHQVEHSNLQFSTVEQLEEEIRDIEAQGDILTHGLHEAEQEYEFLQKENILMKQQVEGTYNGSLQDWAVEIHRLKCTKEDERHKDELKYWKEVAADVAGEMDLHVKEAKQQYEEAEKALRDKLHGLSAELPEYERRLRDVSNKPTPEVGGSVHSVPAPLHGLLAPAKALPPNVASRRKALVIGCNYNRSHKPLEGCTNDAWNVSCLLRHSFGYTEEQVRCFIDGSEHCPSPPSRQPTKANILSGLRWLTTGAELGDNLSLFFCGYGTQLPVQPGQTLHQAYLVPLDFADDLPSAFFPSRQRGDGGRQEQMSAEAAMAASGGATYRLVSLAELTSAFSHLPPGIKVTIMLDCCYSMVPGIDHTSPAPHTFPRITRDLTLQDLAALQPQLTPRLLELPPLRLPPVSLATEPPACCLHCYSACQSQQWCAELPIEGCVQGAFTWAFVKALTAGHLDTTVQQHAKALHSILTDLRHHFRWVEQTPLLQLSRSAKPQDMVLVP